MSDASEADRLEQALQVDVDDEVEETPSIDLERPEADAIEQAQIVPDEDEPAT